MKYLFSIWFFCMLLLSCGSTWHVEGNRFTVVKVSSDTVVLVRVDSNTVHYVDSVSF